MPYSTGAIDKFDIKYFGDNNFVLLCPSKRTNGRVPEYVHYQNNIYMNIPTSKATSYS